MGTLLFSIIIFILIFASGYAGLQVQKRLVDEHKTGELSRLSSHPALASVGLVGLFCSIYINCH